MSEGARVFEPIWKLITEELSGEKAREFVARLWETARWNSFDKIQLTAASVAEIMREIGLEEVQVINYPADGITAYGGWVMPMAWDAREARLEVVSPEVQAPLLADYRRCPQSLMMYSAPTPPEGLEAEVVAVNDAMNPASWEGVDCRRKMVLVDGVGIELYELAVKHGAVGLVSDAMKLAGSPHEKAPGHFDHACQWHNYTLPPWKTDKPLFGFSVSPACGRMLRQLSARSPVRLKATVDARLYDGQLPLVTGLLPGETSEEIAITGHLCEPGANDNSSGVALGLEVVRCIGALVEDGRLPKPRRGIRPVFSFEVRGYQAFLANWPHLRRLVAGINLDMVGCDLSEARARSNLIFNWPVLPSYTDALALALMRRLGRDDPLFRFRTEPGGLVDNLFGEPAVGAPMAVVGNWPDAYYHTSLDTLDHISPRAMAESGAVAATFVAFLAGAGLEEAVWLARLGAELGEDELLETARKASAEAGSPDESLRHALERNLARIRSVCRLVPGTRAMPIVGRADEVRRRLCRWSGLFPEEELERYCDQLANRLTGLARSLGREARATRRQFKRIGQKPRGGPEEPPLEEIERARRLAPRRTFKGSLCFEALDAEARAGLKERTGLGVGWGAPYWLQLACFLFNGKRNVLEVWRWLRAETSVPPLRRFNEGVEFLAEHGFLELRPVLSKEDYLRAFAELRLPKGAVVMVHSSLSQFGYVEGGPETVIEALLEAIGPDGTLAMPTLSCSWLGRRPFDPAKTPTRVGAIPETFRRRPGVLRSPHPTHSVAALGPRASEIVSEHVPEEPVFGPRSPYAKLYDLDGWILMLCRLEANTTLHMAEERAGLLLLDFVAPVLEGRRRREVVVRHLPWHVNFQPHYEVMSERGMLRSARLGESEVHLMRVRDAVDVALENIRRDPAMVAAPGCECPFCEAIRRKLSRGG